jgi:hypothetical protein
MVYELFNSMIIVSPERVFTKIDMPLFKEDKDAGSIQGLMLL